jgi:protein SCO1/2
MKVFKSFTILGLFVLCLVVVQAKSATILVGEQVPDFTLVDQSGQKASLSDYKGKGVVISFLFTRCPYPDKCPMIGKKLTGLAELSEKIGKQNQLQVLAITLDPAHDKPEVLKAYARGFDERYGNWKFLTGTENEIAKVAGAFGVIYWTENGMIEHNMRTAFIDPNGTLQILKSGADWKAGQFAAEIEQYLD